MAAIGACDWPVSYAECGPCTALDAMSDLDREMFEEMAADFLWNWSLRQFGVCEQVLRPCRKGCNEGGSTYWGRGPYPNVGTGPWMPVLFDGRWYNLKCGKCLKDACSCGSADSIALPGPVVAVSEVMIDGVALLPADWSVTGNTLYRLGGIDWPECQDMSQPPGAVNTWTVTYGRGTEVPVGGQVAAGILACEFAKASCNDGSCRLPQRIQSITRQGVTMAVLDDFSGLEKGQTGIWAIDSWVASVTKPRMGGAVYSVDKHPRFRRG